MIQATMAMGDTTFSAREDKVDPQIAAAFAMKLMTTDGATLAEELSQYEIEWPCLSVTCGSADAMLVVSRPT